MIYNQGSIGVKKEHYEEMLEALKESGLLEERRTYPTWKMDDKIFLDIEEDKCMGDIENRLTSAVENLAKAGIFIEGSIAFFGDSEGSYEVSNGTVIFRNQEEVLLHNLPDEDLIAEYQRRFGSKTDEHGVERMLAVNINHITNQTREWLCAGNYPGFVTRHESGWFFYLNLEEPEETITETLPQDLKDIFWKAVKKQCWWVSLDPEGFAFEDLPVYNSWKAVYESEILIPEKTADFLNQLMDMTGDEIYQRYGMKRDETYTYTAKFPDGMEADIKLVICEEENYPFVEGVLFCNGSEVCHTDADAESMFGGFEFEAEDVLYTVHVKAEEEKLSRVGEEIQYRALYFNKETGQQEVLFTTTISELLCKNRAKEKILERGEAFFQERIMIESRKVVTMAGDWK